jgi:hypothetical protein
MIFELKQPCTHILVLDCMFPEALSIIEGNNPGWIFADDPVIPSAALVWAHGMKGFYLIGSAKNAAFLQELDIFEEQELKPRLQYLGVEWFEICGNKGWDPVIENVFRERELASSHQWVYTLEPVRHRSIMRLKVPDDCKLLKVDRHLLINLAVNNRAFLFSKLMQFWGSTEAFLNTGLGYIFVEGEEIASLCFSGFVTRDIHVIDIETGAPFRRRGYAEIIARTFIAECVEKCLQPYWDCAAENTASKGLAEKMGFTRSHVYVLYRFPLHP